MANYSQELVQLRVWVVFCTNPSTTFNTRRRVLLTLAWAIEEASAHPPCSFIHFTLIQTIKHTHTTHTHILYTNTHTLHTHILYTNTHTPYKHTYTIQTHIHTTYKHTNAHTYKHTNKTHRKVLDRVEFERGSSFDSEDLRLIAGTDVILPE